MNKKNAKKHLEFLMEEIRPHSQYWDCYNDVPLEEPHDKHLALICLDKQLELLRYLGSSNPKELYEYLVEQKRLLKSI